MDRQILFLVILLLGVGLVQVYSASYVFATDVYGDGLYFFKKQFAFAILSLATLVVLGLAPHFFVKNFAIAVMGISAFGLLLTIIPGIGVSVGGALRWIQLPFGVRWEPSETFKVTVAFGAVWLITGWQRFGIIRQAAGILFFLGCGAILLRQPDFGSIALITVVMAVLLFLIGVRWKYMVGSALTAGAALGAMIILEPYRLERIKSYLDPWADPSGRGFQTIQSLLGYYSGGLFGVGLGKGQSKLFFLPEAHTDFTLSVFAEEWGLIGVIALLTVFGILIFRMWALAFEKDNLNQKLIMVALTTLFATQSFINFAVSMGALPTKGLSLPFISYGGSSLLSTCILFGIFLNFQKRN